ncbi:MAG: pentapeptide repeat-containing protein [Nitrospiria bacterium]
MIQKNMIQCKFKGSDWQCSEFGYKGEFCIFHIPMNSGIKENDALRNAFFALINKPTKEPIRLDGAIFPNLDIFRDKTCGNEISFQNATFHNGADFTGARFLGTRTSFEKSRFLGSAIFDSTEIQGESLIFKGAFISGSATFKNASISCHDAIDFTGMEIQQGVNFENARLNSKNTSFEKTRFMNGEISFKGTRFCSKEKTSFDQTEFGAGPRQSQTNPIFQGVELDEVFLEGDVNFKNVKISSGKNDIIIFERVNLGRTEFLKTDLSRVKFIDVTWNHQRDLLIFGKWRSRLYDENIWNKNKQFFKNIGSRNTYLTELSYLYRTLKKYYLETGEIGLSGHFHYGYNEVLLAQERFEHGRKFSFMRFLHKITSGYGEDFFVAFSWLFFFISGFAFVYALNGVPQNSDSFLSQFFNSLIYSIQVGTLSRIEFYNYKDKEIGIILKFFHVAESVLVPTFLAFFVIALRNRFRR